MTCLTATISPQYQHRLLADNGRLQPLTGYCRVAGEHRQDGWSVPIGASLGVEAPAWAQIFAVEVGLDDSASATWMDFYISDGSGLVLGRLRHFRGTPVARFAVPIRSNLNLKLTSRGLGKGEAIWFAARFTDETHLYSPSGGHLIEVCHEEGMGGRALLLWGGEKLDIDVMQKTLIAARCDAAFWLTDHEAVDSTAAYRLHAIPTGPLAHLEDAAFTAAAYCIPSNYKEVLAAPAHALSSEGFQTAVRVLSARGLPESDIMSPAVIEPPVQPLTLREVMRWRFGAGEEELNSLRVTERMARMTDLRSFSFWAGKREAVMLMAGTMQSTAGTFWNWAFADSTGGRNPALTLLASCILADAEFKS